MNADIPAGARRILETLSAAGYEACLVGGCVRDLIRGVTPHDWDICTSALPMETRRCFEGWHVIETGLKHGTLTIMDQGVPYEVTTYRVDGDYSDGRRPDSVRFVSDLQEDLARRDFTMNAIAMGLDGALFDPFHGAGDIAAGVIRCVGSPDRRFQEDGLRIMRALRFAASLGYQLESGTAAAIHRCRDMLHHVAAERINVELCKLLTGSGVGQVLRDYPDVLWVFWPQLEPLAALEQNTPWHCWGGWEHTIHAVEAVRPDVTLRLTMLLHDIGKPAVKTTDEQGRDHFYGHPAISAATARRMLRALKFDNDTRARVVALISDHDLALQPQPRSVRRLLNRLGPDTLYLLLEVQRADALAQDPKMAQPRLAALEQVRTLADEIIAQGQCFSLKDLAVTGRDMIDAGAAPGPQVGAVLDALLEMVMNEELPNEKTALLRAVPPLLEHMRSPL